MAKKSTNKGSNANKQTKKTKATTIHITGLTRSGKTLTVEWKHNDKMENQKVEYKAHYKNRKGGSLKWTDWRTLSTSTSITSKKLNISEMLVHNYVESVTFKVSGKGKTEKSSKTTVSYTSNSDSRNFDFRDVSASSIKLKIEDSDSRTGMVKFSYQVNSGIDEKSRYALDEIYFYYCLVKNSNTKPSFSKFRYIGKRSTKSGNITVQDLKDQSGQAMSIDKASDFVWAYFLAVPYSYSGLHPDAKKAVSKYPETRGWCRTNFSVVAPPSIDKTYGWIDEQGYLRFKVAWDPAITKGRPVDEIVISYAICAPDFRDHDKDPSKPIKPISPEWKGDWPYSSKIDTPRSWEFTPGVILGDDEACFVRVTASHAGSQAFSNTVCITDVFGPLTNPTLTNVQTDQTTYKATVNATNNSKVGGSFLRVYATYQSGEDESDGERKYIGKIESGTTTGTFQCDDWSSYKDISFDVQAVAGCVIDAASSSPTVGVVTIGGDSEDTTVSEDPMESVDELWYMLSDIVSQNGVIPRKPSSIKAYAVEGKTKGKKDTIYVEWSWDWDEAQYAEVSWSDDRLAWESTTAPNTYTLASLKPTHCYIPSLETGKTWYIRIRLFRTDGQNSTYGDYSEMVAVPLTANPNRPKLVLSNNGVTETGSVTASWAYESNISDGTAQASAQLYDYVNGEYVPLTFARTETAQHIIIQGSNLVEAGWVYGEKHDLAVLVSSASGMQAEYSETDDLTLVEVPKISIGDINIEDLSVTDEDGTVTTEPTLTKLPLTGTVTTTGEVEAITVLVERTEGCHLDRPDESLNDGYPGEIVYSGQIRKEDNGAFSIGADDLLRPLDDTGRYRVRVIANDDYGQTAEATKDFVVRWAVRAIRPTIRLAVDDVHSSSQITLIKPEGAHDGDVCDIYRLSLDAPQKILTDGVLGNTYYDPYPALGDNGGYRIVYKTAEGNYITENDSYAWLDTTDYDEADIVDVFAVIIDYPGHHVVIPYNITLDNSWSKDFTETKYLGGAVQGDWNLAVSRSLSVSTDVAVQYQDPLIHEMRNLATYTGVCHVRTPDSSCFCGDVQVDENRENKMVNKIAKFSLKITRVDPVEEEMMTQEEWKTYLDSLDESAETMGGISEGQPTQGTTIGDLVNQIKDLQSQINTNASDISGLKTKDTASATDVEALRTRVSNTEADITNLKSADDTTASDINTIKANITSLQNSDTATATTISTIQNDVSTNATNIAANTKAINDMKTQLSSIETRLTALEETDTTHTSDISTLKTDLAALRKKVDDISTGTSEGDSASVAALKSDVADLKTRVSTLETSGTGSADLTELTARVNSLEKDTVKTSDMVTWTDDEINTAAKNADVTESNSPTPETTPTES